MDPITLGLVVVVAAVVAMGGKSAPVAAAASNPRPAGPNPADPSQILNMAPAIFGGAAAVATGFKATMDAAIGNATATARQRSLGPTGGNDPAFVTSGSALAARDFMTRGLNTTAQAAATVADISWKNSPVGMFAQTRTGQAVTTVAVAGATRTGAEVLAMGATAAQAAQQTTVNAAQTLINTAAATDAAVAKTILNNSPF